MAELDPQDDDAVLRDRLGRLASSAARSVGAVEAPEDVRRRGAARRHRRTAAGVLTTGLAVAAVAGVVSGSSVLRSAPVQPAVPSPTVVVTTSPRPTGSPSVPPSPSPSVPPPVRASDPSQDTRTVTRPRTVTAQAVPPPTALVPSPWERPGARFGLLESVSLSPSGGVVVRFRAATYRATGGGGWTGVATTVSTATALPSAYLSGSQVLAPDVPPGKVPADGTRLTASQFVDRARAALTQDRPVPVWLFHATTDPASPLTGVQEQYQP